MVDARPWPAPPGHEDAVVLEPLRRALLDVDLAAYLASPRAITAHSAGRWPTELSREQDLRLVAHHEAEHEAGEAFAYVVLSSDRTRGIGCAYLRPHTGVAVLTFWLLDDTGARPSATVVLRDLLAWTRAWGTAPVLLRVLPEEGESLLAVADLGLVEVEVPGQELPYRWFRA